jgi:hypothetical protein
MVPIVQHNLSSAITDAQLLSSRAIETLAIAMQ